MNYLYNINYQSIPLPTLIGYKLALAVKETNDFLRSKSEYFNGLSKTTIATIFGDKLAWFVGVVEPSIKFNPIEKGYPDILSSTSDEFRNHNIGENIKVSFNFGVSSHHQNTKHILQCQLNLDINRCPFIEYVGSIQAQNNNWSKKPNTDNTQNTPATYIKTKHKNKQIPIVWNWYMSDMLTQKYVKQLNLMSYPKEFWTRL